MTSEGREIFIGLIYAGLGIANVLYERKLRLGANIPTV